MNILEAIEFCDANPNSSVYIPGRVDTRCNTKDGILTRFGTSTNLAVSTAVINGWEQYEPTYDWFQAVNKIMQGKSMRMATMEPGAFLKADPHREHVMYHSGDGSFSETSFMLEWIKADWLEV